MSKIDTKSPFALQEQQIDQALTQLRNQLYQVLNDIASTPEGDVQAQAATFKQRLHAMEIRALENDRKATAAQKQVSMLQAKLTEMEYILSETKDKIITSEARSVELEARLEEALGLWQNTQKQLLELKNENQLLKVDLEASEFRATEAEHRSIANEAQVIELKARLEEAEHRAIEAEERANDAEERAMKMYLNVTEKLRQIQGEKN